MSWFTRIWRSSIGKKVLVAATGLALLGFLFGHIFGNLQLFFGADKLNAYAAGLHEQWFLPLAEGGIIAAFIVHIALVLKLTLENKAARGSKYAVHASKNPGFKYTSSKAMVVSGLVVLTFLVVHILDYRLGRAAHDAALAQCLTVGTDCDHTIGAQVISTLQVPWRAALYALGSLFIGWHLYHGIQSAARSFGVASKKWTPIIEKTGAVIGLGLGVLFASIPVAIYATGGSFGKVDQLGVGAVAVVENVEDVVVAVPTTDQVEVVEVAVEDVVVDADVADAAEEAAEVAEGEAAEATDEQL